MRVRMLGTAIVVALLGVIVLTVTSALGPVGSGQFGDALAPDAAEAVVTFRRAFLAVAGCLAISLLCLACSLPTR